MIAVLTGAGISAESGLSTFRDSGGLWEGHDVMEVASPQGWSRNPKLVNNFYNLRRRDLQNVEPNLAHTYLAELESQFSVHIITQNVDNLHERGGSTQVLHLHGELLKVRSTGDPNLIYTWKQDLSQEDCCDKGFPLRPHIVWFGEAVPLIPAASSLVGSCDLLLIIGTSLQVYPAAGLLHHARPEIPVIYIDPNPADVALAFPRKIHVIAGKVTESLEELNGLIHHYLG